MAGMLPGLFSPQFRDMRQEQRDNENDLQFLSQDPTRAAAYTAYSGAQQAGRGIGQLLGAAAGVDTRSPMEKNVAAVQAAKDQVSKLGFDPNDPKSLDSFYARVVAILQSQGLVAEAAEMQKEWAAQKRADRGLDLKDADLARKKKADDDKARAADERNAIARERLGTSGPEALQLLNDLDKLDPLNPNDEYRRKAIMTRLGQLGGQNGVKFEQLGDRVIVTDMQGNPIRTDKTGAAPMPAAAQQKEADKSNALQTKYNSAVASLQSAYNDAVELYNHPGLQQVVGPTVGIAAAGDAGGKPGAAEWALRNFKFDQGGREALAKLQQVRAGSFIAALQDLKAQSQTGASGLGQLTEVEGAKIQNAKAALDPLQDYVPFRAHLAQYIQQIANSVSLLNQNAQTYHLTQAPFSTKEMLANPGRYTAPRATSNQTIAPSAPTAPAVPPAEPKGGSTERWARVNGKLQRVQ